MKGAVCVGRVFGSGTMRIGLDSKTPHTAEGEPQSPQPHAGEGLREQRVPKDSTKWSLESQQKMHYFHSVA